MHSTMHPPPLKVLNSKENRFCFQTAWGYILLAWIFQQQHRDGTLYTAKTWAVHWSNRNVFFLFVFTFRFRVKTVYPFLPFRQEMSMSSLIWWLKFPSFNYFIFLISLLRAYSIVDSSRVSTFLISILLIVYGSFRYIEPVSLNILVP
jgi:hypothetical protein